MKGQKLIVVLLIVALGLFLMVQNAAAFTLSVKPNQEAGSGSIGLDLYFLTLGVSLDYYALNMNVKMTENDYGYYYEDEISATGQVLAPGINAKLRLGFPKEQRVVPYLAGSMVIFKPTVTIDTGSYEDQHINDTIEEALEKNTFALMTAGLGAEYFFTKSFSIAGEYGVKMLMWQYEDGYNDGYGYSYNIEAISLLNATYATVVLNFSF